MESEFVDSEENRKNIVEESGDTIVSASAGSGKTTVMIRKMVEKIVKSAEREVTGESGDRVGLDNILAVTFTNKAAANMKDRLRARLGEAIASIESDEKYKDWSSEDKKALSDRLMDQYDLIPAADISTVHSFCLNLIKKYFYLAGCAADSDMLGDDAFDDAALRERAFDNLFNGRDGNSGYYKKDEKTGELENERFKTLSDCLRSGRRDDSIKETMMDAYGKVRSVADYRKKLEAMSDAASEYYTAERFDEICAETAKYDREKLDDFIEQIDDYENGHDFMQAGELFGKVIDGMKDFLYEQKSKAEGLSEAKHEKGSGAFDCAPKADFPRNVMLNQIEKISDELKTAIETDPALSKKYKDAIADFGAFKGDLTEEYKKQFGGRKGYDAEYADFCNAGELAQAFARCLLDFDDEYTRVKREEGKLDYNDLEQISIDLLSNHEDVKGEVNGKYRLVFVDEFQDINPAQNRILSYLSGEKFYVGDVKQAIYAFRGSDSQCFIDATDAFRDDADKHVDHLTINFRSGSEIINRVNEVFEQAMTTKVCDIDYKHGGNIMTVSDDTDKPDGSGAKAEGGTQMHVYGKVEDKKDLSEEEKRKAEEEKKKKLGIYSVRDGATKAKCDDGEAAVARLVKRYKEEGRYKEGDICILARSNKRVQAVTKKLEEEGVSIAGSEGGNILDSPEIRQMLDILSYIDDGEQDLPTISAMLSPMGNFTEDELASIKLAAGGKTFGERVREYKDSHADSISEKIDAFERETGKLREAAQTMSAGDLIDKIVCDTDLELIYSQYPEKYKAVSMLAAKGKDIGLSEFLKDVTAKDAKIDMPASASSDGVNVMTMHSAKGLEFPVVIICNASEKFGGDRESTCLFDEKLGLVFKAHDCVNFKTKDTILWKLKREKDMEEDLKQELNLFYVACTRARERLDIVTEILPERYDLSAAKSCCRFADIVDLNGFVDGEPDMMNLDEDEVEAKIDEGKPETACDASFETDYMNVLDATYEFKYMDAPSKTSVTAAIKKEYKGGKFKNEDAEADEGPDEDTEDGDEDDPDAREVGTAYHKFLELWNDPEIRDASEIEKMIDGFVKSEQMSEEQRDILKNGYKGNYSGPAAVAKVIFDKVYKGRKVEKVYHERRFLCNLPAKEVYRDKYRGEGSDEHSCDAVLVQGTIDLLVRYEDGKWHIFDYKHTKRGLAEVHETYDRQLELYRAATAKILHIDEKDIDTELVIINPENPAMYK